MPTAIVYALGKWLIQDWAELGLSEPPELFPKQSSLNEKTKLGNFLRLPGRHHTLGYHTNVWTGRRWVAGDDAIQKILGKKGVSPAQIPAAAISFEQMPSIVPSAPAPVIHADELTDVQSRVLALLKKRLRAV